MGTDESMMLFLGEPFLGAGSAQARQGPLVILDPDILHQKP
jgi:hypothetical protein